MSPLRNPESFESNETSQSTFELQNVALDALLSEILRRKDELLLPEGWLTEKSFALADFLGIRVCVDGVPVRINKDGAIELMAIRRNTGPYRGQYALVGGGVGRVKNENGELMPESIEESLKRHFRVDLGFDIEPIGSWQKPDYLAQDMRPIGGEVKTEFTPNPNSRHLIAARYLVRVIEGDENPLFGATEIGGQEASAVVWFAENQLPADSEFGYGHLETYKAMFGIAQKLLGTDSKNT